MASKPSPEERITAEIIAHLEAGVRPWSAPWNAGGAPAMPLRHNGDAYQGINVVQLWLAASIRGFRNPYWMTYRQAKALGGQVRKGEGSTLVVYYGSAVAKSDGPAADGADPETRGFRFLKGYPVFNVEQIDGLKDPQYAAAPVEDIQSCDHERIARIEHFLAATGANIAWRGKSAYYAPGPDCIMLPDLDRFRDIEQAYATAAHELIHWTGAKHRLDREFGAKFGDPKYAFEELVADIGAAFLGARLGLRPDHIEDHAAYIGGWLQKLRGDKRAILTAASKAQAASDYVLQLAGISTATGAEGDDLAEAA